MKKGDTVTQVIDWGKGDCSTFSGKVFEITDTEIVCIFPHDYYRTKRFNKETGINVLGIECGWLAEVKK